MKLASLKSGRDGQLVVVSRDLSRAACPGGDAAPCGAGAVPGAERAERPPRGERRA